MGKSEAKTEKQELVCPICRLLSEVCECFEGKSELLAHLNNARIEILEGIKSLIESRLDTLRKRTKKEKKATKIEVT